jgi:hypothetical protein
MRLRLRHARADCDLRQPGSREIETARARPDTSTNNNAIIAVTNHRQIHH